MAELRSASWLSEDADSIDGRSIILHTRDQLSTALALIELDGVAARMTLCPPGLSAEHLNFVWRASAADALVSDDDDLVGAPGLKIRIRAQPEHRNHALASARTTEWVLLTSGTTGAPKLVQHTLDSLISAFAGETPPPEPVVWSTFYDIRRYGGVQIFLRGLHGGSLVLSDPDESTADFLERAREAGVTHISGTPSHWRKALMSGAATRINPRYLRSSGEIADQAILDSLKDTFPGAIVAHAFASTEAGVGFEVRDGLAGFPASLLSNPGSDVEMDLSQGTLRLRSQGTAARYLGEGMPPLKDAEGFVDTGDHLELREGRYYFAGRTGGVINVGGSKVYPEEVEAVINLHPRVHMSLVKARKNPITGAVVTADVVLKDAPAEIPEEAVKREILEVCRGALAAYKVPAAIRIVPALAMSASGKLVRPNA